MDRSRPPTTSNPRIAAVFATMNRAATAVACVRALAAQTCPPDLVVVADNDSQDDTANSLEKLAELPFQLVVHRMLGNRGNAGGVEEAMDLAFSQGADAVWILDDDSWPQPDALFALLKGGLNPDVVRHSLQIDPKTGCFTWPLQISDGPDKWMLVNTLQGMPCSDFVKSRSMWTGALVPHKVRETVGPVNGELFIRGEDEEYPWRIEQAGFGFEAATSSILDHPGPDHVVSFQLFGKSFFFERELADWKLYYKIRNMVWLKRKQSGSVKAFAMAIAYALATVRIDGAQRLPLVWDAILDGWQGRLGKWRKHTR